MDTKDPTETRITVNATGHLVRVPIRKFKTSLEKRAKVKDYTLKMRNKRDLS